MKALVIGASGQVGGELLSLLGKIPSASALGTCNSRPGPGLRKLDIADRAAVAAVFNSFSPDTVFLCAAMAHVDRCESEPELARRVNVAGPANVAAACACSGARLVFVSTDYVFDGTKGMYVETDAPAPLNVYGRTKLEAENRLGALCRNLAVARTAMVYSYNETSSNFAMQLLGNCASGTQMAVAQDVYATPTYAPDLAVMLVKLAQSGKTGIYHCAGSERVSRLDFALTACKTFGLKPDFLKPVQSAGSAPKARRPADSSLNVSKFAGDTGHAPAGYRQGLELAARARAEAGK